MLKKEIDYRITEEGCWICTSHKPNHFGHSSLSREGKTWNVARWVWYKYVDSDIEGYIIHHKCENPLCINPDHLEKVTHSEHLSIHGNKLTLTEVKDIYQSEELQSVLAEKYDVAVRTINSIKCGRSRTEITENLKRGGTAKRTIKRKVNYVVNT